MAHFKPLMCNPNRKYPGRVESQAALSSSGTDHAVCYRGRSRRKMPYITSLTGTSGSVMSRTHCLPILRHPYDEEPVERCVCVWNGPPQSLGKLRATPSYFLALLSELYLRAARILLLASLSLLYVPLTPLLLLTCVAGAGLSRGPTTCPYLTRASDIILRVPHSLTRGSGPPQRLVGAGPWAVLGHNGSRHISWR